MYLDYRSQIDWNKYPDMSHVIQACAQAAVARQYTYFAITNYGVCVWGPDGLNVISTRELNSWCFAGLGGLWLVSVYKIKSSGAGTAWRSLSLLRTVSNDHLFLKSVLDF